MIATSRRNSHQEIRDIEFVEPMVVGIAAVREQLHQGRLGDVAAELLTVIVALGQRRVRGQCTLLQRRKKLWLIAQARRQHWIAQEHRCDFGQFGQR
jgi:hypothetical protein